MTRIELIELESEKVRDLTKKLISEIPGDLWYKMPDAVNTNVAWQVGHLVISEYYHAIAVITGGNEKIREKIPLREYSIKFAIGSTPVEDQGVGYDPKILRGHLEFIRQMAREELVKLSDSNLDEELHPTKFPHPVAKTKYEALVWNYQHEMYHMGQIGLLKRLLGFPTTWAS